MAAFLDSDEGFSIYRRFGYLQARLLLDKQEELRLLEEKLQTLDLAIAEVDGGALCSRTLYGPNADEHRKILTEIETVYCSYGNLKPISIVSAYVDTVSEHSPNRSADEGIQYAI